MNRDPRMNAPVCISHLPPEERRLAMIARHRQRTIDFMATYQQPAKVGWAARVRNALSTVIVDRPMGRGSRG